MVFGPERSEDLHLPGPMWNPRASAGMDYSRELKHLARVSTLEQLTFSYTYLADIKFQDDGLEEIASLGSNLKVLSLENTNVRGKYLAAFTQLEALDLTSCPVNDEGLNQLRHATNLTRLLLRDGLITDDGMSSLRGLTKLVQLDLGGTAVSDRGIMQLEDLTRLKQLNLFGAELSDDGLRVLLGLQDLEVLNLYGTRVSNVGVEVLKELKNLRQVDLRYSRVTRSGVEELVAALPGIAVEFVDLAIRPEIPDAGRPDS
jgi:Leucine-rich repeat (LRR) protein